MTWDRGAGVLPTTHRRMTAEEYFQLPEGPPWFQLINGELFMSPSPFFFHQDLIARLMGELVPFVRRHRLGKVVTAPSDVQLDSGNVYQPDLYFVSTARLSIIEKQGPKGAPDLVVEVISASTGRLDLGPKKARYAESGVQEFWAVFPETSEVEVYQLAASAEQPSARLTVTDSLTTPLLPGLTILLQELFES